MFTLAIAGSTTYSAQCATALLENPSLDLIWIMTPAPKLVGRHQELTVNPLHQFAQDQQLPTVLVDQKIDQQVQEKISRLEQPDFLLVVDFGYIIPNWLLQRPRLMPLNIHPSALPKWRGSSPGQFVLLAGEKNSAVSLIEMNDQLDQGPIIAQIEFSVAQNWTQTEYYQHSFQLITEQLGELILKSASKDPTPQPPTSPTPIARRLTKADSFVPWEIISQILTDRKQETGAADAVDAVATDAVDGAATPALPAAISDQPVLTTYLANAPATAAATIISRACRAFSPWPLVWTELPTPQGLRRMQLISCTSTSDHQLILEKVKIAGLSIKPWHEVKNIYQGV